MVFDSTASTCTLMRIRSPRRRFNRRRRPAASPSVCSLVVVAMAVLGGCGGTSAWKVEPWMPTPFPKPGQWEILATVDVNPIVNDGEVPYIVEVIADRESFADAWSATVGGEPVTVDFGESVVLWVRYGYGSDCEDVRVVNIEDDGSGTLYVDLGSDIAQAGAGCFEEGSPLPRSSFVLVSLSDLDAPPEGAEFGLSQDNG